MKRKDLFVALSFAVFAVGLGTVIQRTAQDVTLQNGAEYAMMEPAAGQEDVAPAAQPETETVEEQPAPADGTVPEKTPDIANKVLSDSKTESPAVSSLSDVMGGDTAEQPTEKPDNGKSIDVGTAMTYRSFGSDTAPLTIENFSAYTCPHCGHLHSGAFEQLKKDYIDTGIVRYVVTPFPLNETGLQAAMLAQCVAPEKFEGIQNLLYQNQVRWAYDADPKKALFDLVRFTGVTQPFFDACLNNKDIQDFVMESVRHGSEDYGITGTPTLIVNNGAYTIRGIVAYDALKNKLDAILADVKSKQ